jgi:hypothetical protein
MATQSLVIDLQRDAMNPDVRVSNLLRKAVVVAAKLGQHELRDWAQRELQGYMDGTPCPPYRRVQGQLRAHNPFRGWIPVVFEDADMARALSQRHSGQSVGEIEDLLSRQTGFLQIPLSPDHLQSVFGRTEEYRLGLVPTRRRSLESWKLYAILYSTGASDWSRRVCSAKASPSLKMKKLGQRT